MTITKDDIIETKPDVRSVNGCVAIHHIRNEARIELASKVADELKILRERWSPDRNVPTYVLSGLLKLEQTLLAKEETKPDFRKSVEQQQAFLEKEYSKPNWAKEEKKPRKNCSMCNGTGWNEGDPIDAENNSGISPFRSPHRCICIDKVESKKERKGGKER